jgi:hypothetical protein
MSSAPHGYSGAEAPTQPHVVPPSRRPGASVSRRAAADATGAEARHRRVRLGRRIVTVVLVALLIPVGWSYYRAVTARGTDPVGVRTVEWLKDNGMNGVVNSIEHWWYAHNQPPVGGKLKHGLPHAQGVEGTAGSRKAPAGPVVPPHLPPPPNMQPLVATPLAGEGVWQPTGRTVQGLPAVYTTYFRPDSLHTSLVAAAMWMDTTLLKTVLIPGLQEPGGPNPYGGQVPPDQRGSLVAAFNSGFKINDSRGGYYNFGQQIRPLVNGVAALVIDADGKASVGLWGRDFTLTPTVATVRQNLALLVDGGQLVPGLAQDSNSKWGATLGNNLFVWRSGVGTDASGGLVFVAGPGLSVESLAILLQRAGAVRAMELDINTSWTSAFTYQQYGISPTQVAGKKLLDSMSRSEDRYLVPGERDFFALFAH